MSAEAPAAAAKPAGRFRTYLLGLACFAVAALATPTAILASALLLPALLTCFTETAPGRPLARCMVLYGLAASLPELIGLWGGANNLGAALEMALDVHTVAKAWAAQAFGWLLAEGLPIMGLLVIDAGNLRHAQLLRVERARLADEWPLPTEPTGDTPPPA